LETTGGRTTGNDATPPDAITEIGAVKVCGGAVLGEFATLVNPQHSIPPQIVRLTGITTAMVGNAPTIDAVLPMFFEFAGDSVLVAHNAGFDIGFLRAAAYLDRPDFGDRVRRCCVVTRRAPTCGFQ
ncbi:exonuclease domain-containing protein, partial [Mycobacterium tuberculosis]|uniref:exonuclease domain-containing protein n=1 Tax=Mycobacterium tuberculosis TaxID=1773 RepID=UPI00234FF333